MVFGAAAMLASLTTLGFVPTAEAFPPVLTCEDSHPVVVGGVGLPGYWAPNGLPPLPVNYTSCYLPSIECSPPPGFGHCTLRHLAWISGSGVVQAFAGPGLLKLPPAYGCIGINSCTDVVFIVIGSGSLGTLCSSGHLTAAAFVRLYCSIEVIGFVA